MLKLNLGCGNDIREGYLNVDLNAHQGAIVALDLNKHWWSKYLVAHYGFASEILALDLIEHLDDPVRFLDECWACLNKDGILRIKACGWQNPNYWVDITHKRAFDIKSFDYFDPSTELGQRYGYYTDKKWKILTKSYDRRKNVIISLTPIKEE